MKLIFIFLITTLLAQYSRANNSQIPDSLQNKVNKLSKPDTLRAKALIELASAISNSDTNYFRSVITEAEKLSDNLNWNKGKILCWIRLGEHHRVHSRYNKAKEYFNMSVELATDEELNSEKASGLFHLGYLYYMLESYDTAKANFNNSLIIRELIPNKREEQSIHKSLGVIAFFNDDYNQAIPEFKKGAAICVELNDSNAATLLYYNIGFVYNAINNSDSANYYLNLSEKFTPSNADKKTVLFHKTYKAEMLYNQGKIPQAIEAYMAILYTAEKHNITKFIVAGHREIGKICIELNDFECAEENLQKALKTCYDWNNKKETATILYRLGHLYLVQEKLDTAKKNFNLSLKIAEELNDYFIIQKNYNYLGDIAHEEQNTPLALDYYYKGLKISNLISQKMEVANFHIKIGHIYISQDKIQSAKKTADTLKTLLNVVHSKTLERDYYFLQSEIYRKTNQFELAYEHYVSYKELSDSLLNEKNIRESITLENKFRFEKEKETIELEQSKKDAIQSLTFKRQKNIRNFLITGITLSLCFVAFILRSLNQKRKSNNELAKQKKEIQKQAKELKTINSKLIELDSFKQSLTSMIVHDLKNPLNALINTNNNTPLVSLERVKQSGRQMLNMVLNILDINKYEHTTFNIDKSKQNINHLANTAIDEVLFLAEQKNISISNHISPKCCILADAEVIKRVFINLLTNAVKFTPNNKKIELNLEHTNKNTVKVLVTDEGSGIPQEQLQYVFDKFKQIKSRNSGNVRSSGIGLTFCKLAIEAHDGNIGVISPKDFGTTFWFTLKSCTAETNNNIKSPAKKAAKTGLTLTISDKQLLAPYIDSLQKLLVYETSLITNILNRINTKEGNSNIEKWKLTMEKSLFTMNEQLYRETINKAKQ